MKLNIPKLQMGGVIFNPSLAQPEQKTQGDTYLSAPKASDTKGKEKDAEDFIGDIQKQLVGKGLINEVNIFSKKYENDLRTYESLPEEVKQSYQGKQLRRKLSGDMAELNEISQNYTIWADAVKTIKSNNTIDTAATLGSSFIVKTADGRISTLGFNEYNKEDDGKKYQTLTIAQLMDERNRNPYLAGDDEVIDIAQSAVSFDDITKRVQGFVDKATGSETQKMIEQGYLTGQEARALKAISDNIDAGIYKSTKEVINESNESNLRLALKAATASIGQQGLQVMQAKFLREGVKPEELATKTEEFLLSLTFPKLSKKGGESNKIDFDASATKGLTGSGAGGGTPKNIGLAEQAMIGRVNAEEFSQIFPGLELNAKMNRLPSEMIAKDNKKVLLSESDINKVGMMEKAFTPDGQPIDPTRTVLHNAYVTTLPVIKTASGYQIDYNGAKKVAEFNEQVEKAGLNKEISQLTPAQRIELKTLRAKYGYDKWQGEMMRVIVGQATSYDMDAMTYWGSNRSGNPFYSKPTKAEKELLESIVPKDDKSKNWLDNAIFSHQVFIPAQDASAFRAYDSNQLLVSPDDVMMENYTGSSGSSLNGTAPIQTLATTAGDFSLESLGL